LPARVVDITYGGCGVEILQTAGLPQLGAETAAILDVKLEDETAKWQSIPVTVKHVSGGDGAVKIGFAFGKLKRRHYEVVKDLMYANASEIDAFRSGRRKRRGVSRGLYTFLAWGWIGAMRGMGLLWHEVAAAHFERTRSKDDPPPPAAASAVANAIAAKPAPPSSAAAA
jgi:phage tail sheath gpL-like